jgi:nucleotide-binding universal stress UspA family protein
MPHQDDVLVGLADGEGDSPELAWAAREAHARGTRLRIVHAYQLSQPAFPWESMTDRVVQTELEQAAQRQLDSVLAHVRRNWPGVEVTGVVKEGLARDVLCSEAAQAAVTVVGARRYGPLGTALLGSVSTGVAAAAPGPVVVAANSPGDPAEDPMVVVGVDGSERTEEVLQFAFDYASRHGRELHAVFCLHPDLFASLQRRPSPPSPEHAERWLAEAMAGWRDRYPDVSVRRSVLRESPVAGLVTESLSQELLVVGSRGRHALPATLLGSVSQGVLHRATCPIAIIHPRGPDSIRG